MKIHKEEMRNNKKFKLIIKKLRKSSTVTERSFSPPKSVKSNHSAKTIITRKTILTDMISPKNNREESVNSFDSIFKRKRKLSFDINKRKYSRKIKKEDLVSISEVF